MMMEMGHEEGRMHDMLCALFCILLSFVVVRSLLSLRLVFFFFCYVMKLCDAWVYVVEVGDKGCMHVKRPCLFFFCPSTPL